MKKLILILSMFLFTHAIAETANPYLEATYIGSKINSDGTSSHVIRLYNYISNPLDVMVECDGYVTYCTVSDGNELITSVQFDSGRGHKKIKITILNVNIAPFTLNIRKIISI